MSEESETPLADLTSMEKLEEEGDDNNNKSSMDEEKEDSRMMDMMNRALRAGDFAYDDVKSLSVHVGLFLTIFFGVFDIYLNITAATNNNISLLFIFIAVVGLVTVVVYPLFFGNSMGFTKNWVFLTFAIMALVYGIRLWNLTTNFDSYVQLMQTWLILEAIAALLTVLATIRLIVYLYRSELNFVPFIDRRAKAIASASKSFLDPEQFETRKEDIEKCSKSPNSFLQLLWPKSSLDDGKFTLIFPSKLFIAVSLTIGLGAFVCNVLWAGGDRVDDDTNTLVGNLRSFEAAAAMTCLLSQNLTQANMQVLLPQLAQQLGSNVDVEQALALVQQACNTFVGGPTGSNWLGDRISEAQDLGQAIAIGLKVGSIFSLLYSLFAAGLTFKAFRKLFINEHFSSHTITIREKEIGYDSIFRFCTLFVSNVLWGMLLITGVITLLAGIFSLPNFQGWLSDAYPAIISFAIYALVDLVLVQRILIPKYVVQGDEIKNDTYFRFFMLGLDLFYAPYAVFAGLTKILFLLGFGVLGLMRPDGQLLPEEMRRFDRSYQAYVSLIRFHHREIYKAQSRDQLLASSKNDTSEDQQPDLENNGDSEAPAAPVTTSLASI